MERNSERRAEVLSGEFDDLYVVGSPVRNLFFPISIPNLQNTHFFINELWL